MTTTIQILKHLLRKEEEEETILIHKKLYINGQHPYANKMQPKLVH